MKKVGLILGSKNDMPVAEKTLDILEEFGVEYDVIISSAHRTPERTAAWTAAAENNGIGCIIAYAGMAAHLAGVVAADTTLPVVAVPVAASLSGVDALLSMVQMPGGIPVATMAIGSAGAKNAGLFAVQILAGAEPSLAEKLKQYKKDMAKKVEADHESVQQDLKKRK